MQPVHQVRAVVGGEVGVQPGVDRAGPQSDGQAQQDHGPPGGDEGISHQPRPRDQAADRQQRSGANAGQKGTAAEARHEVADGDRDQQRAHRIQREVK